MNTTEEDFISARLRPMQIIAGALSMGVLMFLVLILFIGNGQNAHGGMIISVLAVGMFAVQAPLSFVAPNILVKNLVRQIAAGTWQPAGSSQQAPAPEDKSDIGKLLAVRQTAMIVALALLEGAAFFACIAYMVEGQPFVLGVIGLALVMQAANFPTLNSVKSWVEQKLAQVAELRQLGADAPP